MCNWTYIKESVGAQMNKMGGKETKQLRELSSYKNNRARRRYGKQMKKMNAKKSRGREGTHENQNQIMSG